MLLILPPRGKLIIQDQVSERIAYAPLFGLRAVSLCFYIHLRAGSLFQVSGRMAYAPTFGLRAYSLCFYILPPGA